MKRRTFLGISAGAIAGLYLPGCAKRKSTTEQQQAMEQKQAKEPFKISLAQWSWHRRLRGEQQPALDNLDFAKEARAMGFEAVEYVNQFFMDKAKDTNYMAEMKKRAEYNGVKSLLIMCDGEGNLGDPDTRRRLQAVEKHYKWLDAAKFLGCHSIRVNAYSRGTYDEQLKLAADGLRRLSEQATGYELNVIVENHGGLSSNGQWLTGVMKEVNLPNCGTLPDFGNFPDDIDRYEAVETMMPYAKAVSAKSHDFNQAGDEIHTNFYRMMKIVIDSGYDGYVDVEYEGSKLTENEGVLATKKLLEKIKKQYMTA